MRIENVDDGAIRAAVGEGWEKVATERLGPAIREDARRYCPVDTGALRDSIEDSYDEASQTLYVTATGDGERNYAYYVETGHRVYHPSTGQTGPSRVAPESFLRPAIYQQRAL